MLPQHGAGAEYNPAVGLPLRPPEDRLLEEVAAEQKRSVSELIRQGVVEVLRIEGRPSNYVLVETFALVQRRLGMDAVRAVERERRPPDQSPITEHDGGRRGQEWIGSNSPIYL